MLDNSPVSEQTARVMPSFIQLPANRFQRGGVLHVVLIVLLVITAVVGVRWYLRHGKRARVTYETVTVERGDLTQSVLAVGTLNPVLNVQVGSQISGIIQKLYVDYNSPVKAHQVVAQIDPATYRADLAQADGDLASAKAALELAQISARRTAGLRKTNAAPQATLDQAIATLHQAEAAVKIKEGALDRAKVDLDRCTIESPIDGIVISRSVDVGQTVAASLSAPVIFTIANDLTKMQIDTSVAEADIGNVAIGQDVEFTVDAFPYRTFHGKVIQVRNAPTTVQNVVTYDTVIEVKNEDMKLKPGMTANASLIVATRDDVLKVGNAAFRFRMPEAVVGKHHRAPAGTPLPVSNAVAGQPWGGGDDKPRPTRRFERTVYVLPTDATEPKPVQIKIGISDGIATEVVSGLNEGDRLVIASSNGIGSASQPGMTSPFGGQRRY